MRMNLILKNSIMLFLFLFGCKSSIDSNEELVVYVSADEQIARQVFSSFSEKTGIDIVWVGDNESSKNTGLVNRIRAEKDNCVADVFWSSEILGTIQLSDEGFFRSCNSELAQNWPGEFKDSELRWFGFSPRARVIAYDPKRTSRASLPNTWWEFNDAVIADPRFGTTRTHVSVMGLFPEKSEELFVKMKKPLLGGNASTVQAVVDGIATYAMTDSDDVYAAQARGCSIEMLMPRHHSGNGGGTLYIPNTVGIIRGTSRIKKAEMFVDFLLSDEVARLLANSSSHNYPIQPAVAREFPALQIIDPLVVDFAQASKHQEAQVNLAIQEMLR